MTANEHLIWLDKLQKQKLQQLRMTGAATMVSTNTEGKTTRPLWWQVLPNTNCCDVHKANRQESSNIITNCQQHQREKEVEKCVPKAWAVLDFFTSVFEVMVYCAPAAKLLQLRQIVHLCSLGAWKSFSLKLSDPFNDSGTNGSESLHFSSTEQPSSLKRKWYFPLLKIPTIFSFSTCIRFATPRKYFRSVFIACFKRFPQKFDPTLPSGYKCGIEWCKL
jgi:hypothetical protein